MLIERKQYVDKLFGKSWNGKVKIITGIRRCGKSFLLRTLYKQALIDNGVSVNNFIEIDLEKAEFADGIAEFGRVCDRIKLKDALV